MDTFGFIINLLERNFSIFLICNIANNIRNSLNLLTYFWGGVAINEAIIPRTGKIIMI